MSSVEGLVRGRYKTHPTPVDPRSHVMLSVEHCSVFPVPVSKREDLSRKKSTVRVVGIGSPVPGGFQSKRKA